MSEIVRMSSKGQIVIPKSLRDHLDLDSGTNFAVFGENDTLVLKKVTVPTAKEAFETLHKWGVNLAKEKAWKESSVMRTIHKRRGVKGA
jgi:antitoxin PrlF